MCTTCVRGQKRAPDPLKQDLRMVGSHHGGPEYWVFARTSALNCQDISAAPLSPLYGLYLFCVVSDVTVQSSSQNYLSSKSYKGQEEGVYLGRVVGDSFGWKWSKYIAWNSARINFKIYLYLCFSLAIWLACWCPQRPEVVVKSPGSEVTGGCELPGMGPGNQTQVLWKRKIFLTVEPSLQTPVLSMFNVVLSHYFSIISFIEKQLMPKGFEYKG